MAKPIPTPIPDHVKARFWAKVEVRGPDECWEWQAGTGNNGYGQFHVPGHGGFRAHRLALHFTTDGLSLDLVVDHLCRNRACCNPTHLEQVPNRENVRRGKTGEVRRELARLITHCKHGHTYTPENTYVTRRGHRNCRVCLGAGKRRWNELHMADWRAARSGSKNDG